MLNLALELARQGWHVFPAKPVDARDSKAPYVEQWQRRSSTDPDIIEAWWLRYPGAIPAVHTGASGLVVFDIEGQGKAHNDATPVQNAEALGLTNHPTLVVSTPSGGLHFYYEGVLDNKRKLYVDGEFVGDCQAANSYVIPAGVPGYKVARGGAVKPLPRELREVGAKERSGTGFTPLDNVGAGQRNDYLAAVGGGLRRFIVEFDTLLAALEAENQRACKPPLPHDEVVGIARSVGRYDTDGIEDWAERRKPRVVKPASTEPAPVEQAFELSDLGNSRRFTARWGHAARYVPQWGQWVTWDGMRWKPDTSGQAERWLIEALLTCGEVEPGYHADTEVARKCSAWLAASQSRRRIEDALTLASRAPGMHVTPDDLDGRADLLNCPNGMVDLRTGKLLPHDPEALCTMVTKADYNPEARSERFEDFLREVFPDVVDTGGIVGEGQRYDDDGELRGFVQRVFGYTLLGAPDREQALFVHYGMSASGKSTLIESFKAALGDYQQAADVEAVLARKRGQHPHDLAQLRGARMVDTSELDSGERLSESVVKRVTSGERINARFMRQNLFTYLPTWVLHVTTNHGFTLGAGGQSMERRIIVIPWTVSFAGKRADKRLRDTLMNEGEALLAWAVRGAVEYHQRGYDLARPLVAVDVGRELFRDADPIAAFVSEALTVTDDAGHYVTVDALYSAFRKWWAESGRKGEPDMTKHAFGLALSRKPEVPKSTKKRIGSGVVGVRQGVRLQGEYS